MRNTLVAFSCVVTLSACAVAAPHAARDKGYLSPGSLADLAVLSADVFTVPANELPAITSVLTMIDGHVVYDAGKIGRPTP